MIHDNERKAFERGAALMQEACAAEFDRRVSALRQQQRNVPADDWSIISDLRLSADISQLDFVSYMIRKMPLPEFCEDQAERSRT